MLKTFMIHFSFDLASSLDDVGWIYCWLWFYVCKNVESLQNFYQHGNEKRGKLTMNIYVENLECFTDTDLNQRLL